MSTTFARLIKWLMNEYRKIIDTIHDTLPQNAKKTGFPKFIWINPTHHCNYWNNVARKKFGVCLENCTKNFDNHVALRLVHKWDFNDTSIYLKEEQRFTTQGLCDYWTSVDKTIEYFETKWTNNPTPKKNQARNDEGRQRFQNDPVWDQNRGSRSGSDRHYRRSEERRPLPPPNNYRR